MRGKVLSVCEEMRKGSRICGGNEHKNLGVNEERYSDYMRKVLSM